ncbi:short chain dehydrogenase [bacterium]|nr:MAG: short chain dehydrogenase [bacterium]
MKAIVIGATGTIGKGIASELESKGYKVFSGTRKSIESIDIESDTSVHNFFEQMDRVDAIICAAGSASFVPLNELDEEKIQFSLNSKLAGQLRVAKYGIKNLKENGAIILTGGMFAYEPWPSSSILSTINKGLEGFVKAVTLEMEEGKRIMIAHPPFLSETAEMKGMPTDPWPNSSEVAKSYSKALESGKSGDIIYVDGYEPK